MKRKEKAMPKQLIRVVYPMDGGKIIASDGREFEREHRSSFSTTGWVPI